MSVTKDEFWNDEVSPNTTFIKKSCIFCVITHFLVMRHWTNPKPGGADIGESENARAASSKARHYRNITFLGLLIVVVLVTYFSLFREEVEEQQILSHSFADIEGSGGNPDGLPQNQRSIFPGCVDPQEYKEIKAAIDGSRSRIHKDWNIQMYPHFNSFFHVPRLSWDIQKNKFTKLILDRMSTNSSSQNKPFVVGFSGSSVTAGHDNYFRDAFPQKFQEAVAPVFQALKIPLEVRNHALGNNPCYPYDACIETHLGDDLDVLAWEQSMNCGRDPKPIEQFLRDAIKMPKTPTVWMLLSGTPYWTASECASLRNSSNVFNKSLTHEETVELDQPLKDVANNAGHLEAMGFLNPDAQNHQHSKKTMIDSYSGTALMGQNVLSVAQYKCQGPYGETFSTKSPGLSAGAPWHPGVLGHKLKGDNLAYVLLAILEDALYDIEESVNTCHDRRRSLRSKRTLDMASNATKSTEQGAGLSSILGGYLVSAATFTRSSAGSLLVSNLYNRASEFLQKFQNKNVPEQPLFCDPLTCQKQTLAKCYTDFEPRMKNPVKDIIIGSKPITTDFSTVGDILIANISLSDAIFNGNASFLWSNTIRDGWSRELAFFDYLAVKKSEIKQLGYLDRKYIYVSHGTKKSLSFIANVTNPSYVWICECQKGFLKYPAIMGDLDVASSVYIQDTNGQTDLSSFVPNKKSLIELEHVADQCYRTKSIVRTGTHAVSIFQKSPNVLINVAYVLYW